MQAPVLVDGNYTYNDFDAKTGVKQGCMLAPILFSNFLAAVLHFVKKNMPIGISLRFDDILNIWCLKAMMKATMMAECELQYADDNAIVAHTEEHLKHAMNSFNSAYTAVGLKRNVKKTQVLYQPKISCPTEEQPLSWLTMKPKRMSKALLTWKAASLRRPISTPTIWSSSRKATDTFLQQQRHLDEHKSPSIQSCCSPNTPLRIGGMGNIQVTT